MLGDELLRGDRLRLAALTPSDAATIARWYASAEFMRLFDGNAAMPKSEQEVLNTLDGWRKNQNAFMFALRRGADEALVGMGGCDEVDWRNRAGWLSLALGREHWGQGYGTEALRLILRHAFMELDLHRVQLTVFAYNERALALYRKAGFTREGTFREFLWRDGLRYDMILMGMLAREWRETENLPKVLGQDDSARPAEG